MADFTARVTAGGISEAWSDPAFGGMPSRVTESDYPHRRIRVAPGASVTIKAKPDGLSEGAADALLGGRLFHYSWSEWPGNSPPPAVSQPGGQSSAFTFTVPATHGHYLLTVRRQDGGGFMVPFDVG